MLSLSITSAMIAMRVWVGTFTSAEQGTSTWQDGKLWERMTIGPCKKCRHKLTVRYDTVQSAVVRAINHGRKVTMHRRMGRKDFAANVAAGTLSPSLDRPGLRHRSMPRVTITVDDLRG